MLLGNACGLSVSPEGSGAGNCVVVLTPPPGGGGCHCEAEHSRMWLHHWEVTFGRFYAVPAGPQLRPVKGYCLKKKYMS